MSSDSPATAIGRLKFGIKLSKIIQNFAEQFYKKLKFQDRLMADFSKDALILNSHIALSKFTGAQHTFLQTMYRCSERLRDWDKSYALWQT